LNVSVLKESWGEKDGRSGGLTTQGTKKGQKEIRQMEILLNESSGEIGRRRASKKKMEGAGKREKKHLDRGQHVEHMETDNDSREYFCEAE